MNLPKKSSASSRSMVAVAATYLPSRRPHPTTLCLALCETARTLVMACRIMPATCRFALFSCASGTMEWMVTFVILGMLRKVRGWLSNRSTSPLPRGPRNGRFL